MSGTPTSPVDGAAAHHYRHVKWFHAVDSQVALLAAAEEITRTYFGPDARPRRASIDSRGRSPASISSTEVTPCRGGQGESEGNPISPSTSMSALPGAPASCSVFGIEADVHWHPVMERAVMAHDPVPASNIRPPATSSPASHLPSPATEATGEGDITDSPTPSPPPPPISNDSTSSHIDEAGAHLSLEVFLYTIAQSVQGWKTRASSLAAPHAHPLRIIVKLDFKAFKAARQFLTHVEGHSWAGLEALCAAAVATPSRRRPSLRAYALSRSASTSFTSAPALVPSGPPVVIELWWNGDVVAQSGAAVHPLSFPAAPAAEVQSTIARTVAALRHRIAVSVSLGWALRPRAVSSERLSDSAAGASTSAVFVTYNMDEDAARMNAFIDGLAAALAEVEGSGASRGDLPFITTPTSATTAPGAGGQNAALEETAAATNRSLFPPLDVTPALRLHHFTVAMLFESVFADSYSDTEKAEAAAAARARDKAGNKNSTISIGSALAAAPHATESRLVAASVLAHANALFFTETEKPKASGTGPAALLSLPRCFPTFWKVMVPSARAGADVSSSWQAEVNSVARILFPYCTIDG